jgi:Flp pilus assembly pilin Flp
MAEKTYQPSFDPMDGTGTDYALIATGVAAALIALIYLILI